MSWRGIFACSSISRTLGRISRSAKSYTLSRNSASSSRRLVSPRRVSACCTFVFRESFRNPQRAREMQRANLRVVEFQVVLSRKRRSTTGMSRAPIAVFLAASLAVIQAGTGRRRPRKQARHRRLAQHRTPVSSPLPLSLPPRETRRSSHSQPSAPASTSSVWT